MKPAGRNRSSGSPSSSARRVRRRGSRSSARTPRPRRRLPTRSGCSLPQIVKTLVLVCGDGAAAALVPGDRRVDPAKVAALVGARACARRKTGRGRDGNGVRRPVRSRRSRCRRRAGADRADAPGRAGRVGRWRLDASPGQARAARARAADQGRASRRRRGGDEGNLRPAERPEGATCRRPTRSG